jgi:Rieske Fe-S protein
MADHLTRRTTLAGAAGLGLGLPLLAACGGGGGGDSASGSGSDSGSSGDDGSSAKAGTVLGPASDIAVGGGKVYGDENVVVTQPEAGSFKAFSATCTHQGCQVSKVAAGTIDCNCHFSKFSIADGSVEDGPASKPLPSVGITVANGQITVS